MAILNVPALLMLGCVLAGFTGGWTYLPAALGIAAGLFAIAVALSGWVAVTAPYAVPPSQNAFASGGAGQGCAAVGVALLAVLTALILGLPLLGLLAFTLLVPPAWGSALLLVGPAYGLAVGAAVRRAAAALGRTQP